MGHFDGFVNDGFSEVFVFVAVAVAVAVLEMREKPRGLYRVGRPVIAFKHTN